MLTISPSPPLAHRRQHGLRAIVEAVDVDPEDRVPIVVADVRPVALRHVDPGIVDQRVDGAVLGRDPLAGGEHRRAVRRRPAAIRARARRSRRPPPAGARRRRPDSTRRQPARASRRAAAAPIPVPAPVIQTSLSARSRITRALVMVGKALALGGEPLDQRGRLPDIAIACRVEAPDLLQHLAKPLALGPEHRAAAIDRVAIAVDIDDVDVRGAQRDALVEDLGALVDQRQHGAVDDLVGADPAALVVLLAPLLLDDPRQPPGRGSASGEPSS